VIAGPELADSVARADSVLDGSLGRRHPLRILLAEDNRINQRVALLTLERMGYSADLAENGEETLAALETRRYDVVLMDVHMPEMDGLEATRRIRAAAAAAAAVGTNEDGPEDEGGIPAGSRGGSEAGHALGDIAEDRPRIVAMTASVLQEERYRCFEAGMDDWVSKPIDVEELAAVLERCPRRAVEDLEAPAGAGVGDQAERASVAVDVRASLSVRLRAPRVLRRRGGDRVRSGDGARRSRGSWREFWRLGRSSR
jgi:CheY-like chemotaxis protein